MNFGKFYEYYISNLRSISAVTILTNIREVDEDLLDANICWIVTDYLLAENPNNAEEITLSRLFTTLIETNLIIISQNIDNTDKVLTFMY